MKFIIEEKLPTNPINYAWLDVDDKFFQALANKLTDEEYHELCHQLNGTKAEYDGIDDGECHREEAPSKMSLQRKKFWAVKDSLYRGVFEVTMARLAYLREEEWEKNHQDELM